jgi:hypothetical protein
LLAVGSWQLAFGGWQLAVGSWQLGGNCVERYALSVQLKSQVNFITIFYPFEYINVKGFMFEPERGPCV